jgi:hypothetical protein
MKKTKVITKLLFTVLLFSFSAYLHSQVNQVYNAGYVLTNYVDIEPDTLINYICTNQRSNESYYIDINGDLENDFSINASCVVSMASIEGQIRIYPLNPNAYARFGRYDSVYVEYGSYWWVSKVALPLQYADTINPATSVWYNGHLTLTESSHKFGTFKSVTDWVSPDDKYIAIKYQDSTDTIYGWIRVNIPIVDDCLIKDYSFSSFFTDIQETGSDKFNIYPNPAARKLFIERTSSEEMELRLFDIAGKQVMATTISKSKITEIDVSGIRRGTYILKLTENDNSFNKKIVIE